MYTRFGQLCAVCEHRTERVVRQLAKGSTVFPPRTGFRFRAASVNDRLPLLFLEAEGIGPPGIRRMRALAKRGSFRSSDFWRG